MTEIIIKRDGQEFAREKVHHLPDVQAIIRILKKLMPESDFNAVPATNKG